MAFVAVQFLDRLWRCISSCGVDSNGFLAGICVLLVMGYHSGGLGMGVAIKWYSSPRFGMMFIKLYDLLHIDG